MRAMITGRLIGASVFLFISFAQANPIDDCNQSDDAEKQINGCSEFLQLDPFSPYIALAYGRRGEAYMRKGDLAHAIADYSTAIELDSGYRDAYANRAVLYDHKGEKERAIADYRAALAKNPTPQDRKDLEAALKRLGAAP